MRAVSCWAVILLSLGAGARTSAAQSLWIDPASRGGVEVQVARSFPTGEQQFLSGAARLAGAFPLGSKALLHLELPVARSAYDGFFGSSSETRVGAPYIGLVSADPEAKVQFQVGARFAPWNTEAIAASILGIMTDPERSESFGANFFAPRMAVQFGGRGASGLIVQGRIGGTALFSTRQGGADPEFLVDYGARVGSESAAGFIFADLSGRLFLTESGSLGDRTVHHLGVSGGLGQGRVTPTAEIRVPLSDSGMDLILRLGARLRR